MFVDEQLGRKTRSPALFCAPSCMRRLLCSVSLWREEGTKLCWSSAATTTRRANRSKVIIPAWEESREMKEEEDCSFSSGWMKDRNLSLSRSRSLSLPVSLYVSVRVCMWQRERENERARTKRWTGKVSEWEHWAREWAPARPHDRSVSSYIKVKEESPISPLFVHWAQAKCTPNLDFQTAGKFRRAV